MIAKRAARARQAYRPPSTQAEGGCRGCGSQLEVAIAVRLATEALGTASKFKAFGGDVHVANASQVGDRGLAMGGMAIGSQQARGLVDRQQGGVLPREQCPHLSLNFESFTQALLPGIYLVVGFVPPWNATKPKAASTTRQTVANLRRPGNPKCIHYTTLGANPGRPAG